MTKTNTINNKGFILIACYMIITLLIILSTGFAVRSVGERRVSQRTKDAIQAFWLAEAGIDKAISELPDSPLSGTLDTGDYYVETSSTSNPTRFLIVSKGGIPHTDDTDTNNTIRTVSVIVEQPTNTADPSGITSAITANGDVEIKGSVDIEGNVDPNAVFDFTEIFGISKDTMKSSATNLYSNPENNVTPVTDITWADVPPGEEMIISASDWTGSGILIVNGNARITGGDFSGIIWVIGTLWISGSPNIEGAIFVESGAEFDTTVTGNADIQYDSEAVSNAFNYIPSDLPPSIIVWKE